MSETLDLSPSRPSPRVSSQGYGDAEILFLGGFPLKDDLASNSALSGNLGSTLETFLREQSLTLRNVYRSLYIREPLEYSGFNSVKLRIALSKVPIKFYESLLLEELKEVNPNIIVPLDDVALSAVYPKILDQTKPRGRKHWVYCYRGSILPLRLDFQQHFNHPIKIIPTIGPQLLNIDWTARAFASIDFKRIVDNRYNNSPITDPTLRWVVKSSYELSTYLNRSFYSDPPPKFLVFDIETYGGLLTCISFSFDGREGVSVPLTTQRLPTSEVTLLWMLVAKVLSSKIPKINQNIKYDWTILERHGFNVENVTGDTMLATSLLYPELPKGLDFLTSVYTVIPYYKDEGKVFDPKRAPFDQLYLYNAQDSIATHQVHSAQLTELEETGMLDLYEKEIVPLIPIYKSIDNTGIKVDETQKRVLLNKYTTLYHNSLEVLRQLTGVKDFNPKSYLHVGKFIYEELKFPKRIKNDPETGKSSYRTDKETLDDLIINYSDASKFGDLGRTILNRIIICRKLSKIIEYIKTPIHPDGRWRGTSNLAGTETGRTTSSKSLDEILEIEHYETPKRHESRTRLVQRRLGRSLQTITKHGFVVDEDIFEDFEDHTIAKDLRSMFVPDRGYAFVEVDGSGAEARVVALLCNDLEFLESFDQKPKIHARTAGMIFGVDPFTITKESPTIPILGIPFYDLGKRIRHAGNYNMGAGRLSQMTHLPMRDCDLLLAKFHNGNPKIRQIFHHTVIEQIRKHRVLQTPFGRRRDFFGRLDESIYKEAIAYIPQSTVSDLTKFSLRRILQDFPSAIFLTEQHDGLLSLVRTDRIYEYAEIASRIMSRPISYREGTFYRDYDLSIPAEVSFSTTNWMQMEDLHLDSVSIR